MKYHHRVSLKQTNTTRTSRQVRANYKKLNKKTPYFLLRENILKIMRKYLKRKQTFPELVKEAKFFIPTVPVYRNVPQE